MKFTRRTFLGYSVGALGAAALGGCGSSQDNLLTQPPSASAAKGGVVEVALTAQQTPYNLAGAVITAPTYDGQIPGPVIRVRPGDQLRVHLKNDLPVPVAAQSVNLPNGSNITNLHVHGMHVSPEVPSDDVFLELNSGEEFDYIYDIPADHPAGTYFYHPHRHGSVSVQLWGGMGGPLIVEGDIDQVPEVAAARDLIFMMQEIRVGADGFEPAFTALFPPFLRQAPARFPVNGAINPVIKARPGEVIRLRVIHGGVSELLKMAVDSHDLHLLGLDGVTFASCETVKEVLLSPANRADLLIRAGSPGTYAIRKLAYDQGFGLNPEVVIATLVVEGEAVNMGLPGPLPAPYRPITDDEITRTRALTFETLPPGGGQPIANFVINGAQFDPNRVDQVVELGAVEEWTVTNTSHEDHPIHVHINHFQVMQIGDTVLDPPRWMDTVNIPSLSSVRFRTRFRDFTGRFVLHCHITIHECLGMMEVIDVVPPEMSQADRDRRVAVSRKLLEQANMRAMPEQSQEFCTVPRPYRRLRWGGPEAT